MLATVLPVTSTTSTSATMANSAAALEPCRPM
jgi:hypothetical protein